MSEVVLRVEGLGKRFPVGDAVFRASRTYLRAVDDITFALRRGLSLGLVGESGAGKSTLGLLLLRLIERDAGAVYFRDRDIFSLERRQMQGLRRHMQVVFQDPDSSLNPRRTVGQTVSEPLIVHGLARSSQLMGRTLTTLDRVGLGGEYVDRYPHELSGGQKQRVAIARALVTSPDFVVFDEPTSALDVSVQARILQLIRSIKDEMDLTSVFISHDLSVVRQLCDEIAVMYLGRVVEHGPISALFGTPRHPYTQALIAAIPSTNPHKRKLAAGGATVAEPPSQLHRPAGCAFHPRCPLAMPRCTTVQQFLRPMGPGQFVACHLYD